MKSVFSMALIFVGGQAVILGFGIAEGFLIHWAIPAIGLDGAILAAVLTTVAMIYVFAQVANSIVRTRSERADASEDDEEKNDEDDGEDDEDFNEELEHHVKEIDRLLRPPLSSQHRRRRKR